MLARDPQPRDPRRRTPASPRNARAPRPHSAAPPGAGRAAPPRSSAAIRPAAQGRPRAPRPIITPSAPDCASAARAPAASRMSPLTMHRDPHRALHRRHRRPVRRAGIELRPRAPVHRDHRHARRLGPRRELRRVQRWPRPSRAASSASPARRPPRPPPRPAAAHGRGRASAPRPTARRSPSSPGQPMLMSRTRAPCPASRRAASAIGAAVAPASWTVVRASSRPSSARAAAAGAAVQDLAADHHFGDDPVGAEAQRQRRGTADP